MTESHLHIASTLGLLLAMSLLGGILAEFVRIPKVTAYLLVGMLLGPALLDVIPREHVESFDPFLKLAMALVLFNLGTEFPLRQIRRIVSRSVAMSVGEQAGTFVCVTGSLALCGMSLTSSSLLGCLALATAPATTMLVLKELRASGPVTTNASFLVAMNNLTAIVAFEVLFLAIKLVHGDLARPAGAEVLLILRDLGGSVLMGMVGGFVVSYGCGLLSRGRWLVLLVAITTFLLGMCETFSMPYLLTFLVMGLIVANTSDERTAVSAELDHITGLLCVLFFAVHGAELDLTAFLAAGMLGVVYIVGRLAGKQFGTWAAATFTKQPDEVRKYLGRTLFAQAGAAIALSSIAVERDPVIGRPIQTIILGSVVVFEILGPLFIRHSLVHAGEVPIGEAIRHSGHTPFEQLVEWIDRVRVILQRSVAIDAGDEGVSVSHLVQPRTGVLETAGLVDVLSYMERSHDALFPIVDEQRQLIGVIRYPALSDVMYDQSVSRLVCAADLATPAKETLHPETSLAEAARAFHRGKDDCIPVVASGESGTGESGKLIGVIRRSDVMHEMIRRHRSTGSWIHGSKGSRAKS